MFGKIKKNIHQNSLKWVIYTNFFWIILNSFAFWRVANWTAIRCVITTLGNVQSWMNITVLFQAWLSNAYWLFTIYRGSQFVHGLGKWYAAQNPRRNSEWLWTSSKFIYQDYIGTRRTELSCRVYRSKFGRISVTKLRRVDESKWWGVSMFINTVFRLAILEYLSIRSDYFKIILKFSFRASQKKGDFNDGGASFDGIFQNPSHFLFLMLIRVIVF